MWVLVTDMSICCFILALLNVNNGTIDPGPKAGIDARPTELKGLYFKIQLDGASNALLCKVKRAVQLQPAARLWAHCWGAFNSLQSLIMLPFFVRQGKNLFNAPVSFLTLKCLWRGCCSHSEKYRKVWLAAPSFISNFFFNGCVSITVHYFSLNGVRFTDIGRDITSSVASKDKHIFPKGGWILQMPLPKVQNVRLGLI